MAYVSFFLFLNRKSTSPNYVIFPQTLGHRMSKSLTAEVIQPFDLLPRKRAVVDASIIKNRILFTSDMYPLSKSRRDRDVAGRSNRLLYAIYIHLRVTIANSDAADVIPIV